MADGISHTYLVCFLYSSSGFFTRVHLQLIGQPKWIYDTFAYGIFVQISALVAIWLGGKDGVVLFIAQWFFNLFALMGLGQFMAINLLLPIVLCGILISLFGLNGIYDMEFSYQVLYIRGFN